MLFVVFVLGAVVMDLPEELPEKCENNLHQQFQMLPLVLETLHYIENGDSARADQMVFFFFSCFFVVFLLWLWVVGVG